MPRDFETEWRAVRGQVLACCRRLVGAPDVAEDIFQEVALRAWRGYPSFRGDSGFLSWVLQIARRETYRVMSRPRGREVSLEADTVLPPTPVLEETDFPEASWIVDATRAATTSGELTDREVQVILARLAQPEASWDHLGTTLGLSGSGCAVTHCRAIPKLRVFLFVQRPDLLGGHECIAQAFARALVGNRDRPLTADEAQAFRRVVLEQQTGSRRVGWRQALRAACDRVIKELPLP